MDKATKDTLSLLLADRRIWLLAAPRTDHPISPELMELIVAGELTVVNFDDLNPQGSSDSHNVSEGDVTRLSHREREVATLVVQGLSSAEVALALDIAVNTVNAHLQRAYRKLGVCCRQELALLWASAPLTSIREAQR
ncbi:helix-turn-helix transcriptional regulator [Pseudarthrobacter sp. J1738]|uniref:helix-turn-helix transcriptional regulator n=1 Tax=Pseudarthrobacter sp. J1738 TaxID=3420446 RepID=UPI003D2861D1